MFFTRRLAISLLLISPFAAFGQDEVMVAEFQQMASQRDEPPIDRVIKDLELKIDQARETEDPIEEVRSARNLGLVYLERVHDYERSLDLFIQALGITDSLSLTDQRCLLYVAIAKVFEEVGDYRKSAQFLEQALSINRSTRHINADALILNNLGKVYASIGQLEKALGNYQQVLKYKHDIDRAYEAEALFNLGHVFTLQGRFDKALDLHREALQVHRALNNRREEAASLNDIGVLYGIIGNKEKSQANHLVALSIRERLNDKKGMAESHNNLAEFQLKKGNGDDAIAHGLLALENGRESQAREQMLRSYELLSEAFKLQADFRKALEYRELGLAISDFINSEKQERRLLEAESRYALDTKESRIQKLDALRIERERQIADGRRFRNVLFLVVILIFMTAGLLLILYLVKRRSNVRLEAARREVEQKNEKLEDLIETKDKFFSIISHDLKGPLNSLTSFSRLLIDHTDQMSKEEIQLLARDLDKSVRNLLTLLENLLEWSRSQTGNIDFTPEEFDLTGVLLANKALLDTQAGGKHIHIEVTSPTPLPVRLHRNSFNTIVRNLISNAIKFTTEGGSIYVTASADKSGLTFSVRDTGVGMSQEVVRKLFRIGSKHSTRGTANEKGSGLGLILCREFVEKNGGFISVDSEEGKGSTFTCTFPATVLSKKLRNQGEAVSQ